MKTKGNIGMILIIGFLAGGLFFSSIENQPVLESSYINYESSELDVASQFYTSNYNNKNEVFICKGPKSKRFHYTSDCRGLKRCSTKIYMVSLQEAKNLHRTLCGYED